MPVQVTPEQMQAISRWAQDVHWITDVWLFGSRARGTAKPDSDFDIAVTIRRGGKGNTSPDTLWVFEHEGWEASLSSALQSHVSFYPKDALPERPSREAVLIWCRAEP